MYFEVPEGHLFLDGLSEGLESCCCLERNAEWLYLLVLAVDPEEPNFEGL